MSNWVPWHKLSTQDKIGPSAYCNDCPNGRLIWTDSNSNRCKACVTGRDECRKCGRDIDAKYNYCYTCYKR